jgi:hypothetical protein
MRDEVNTWTLDFALDVGGFDVTPAHDAGSAGASVGLGHSIAKRQVTSLQPDSYLLPQLIV